MIIRCSAYISIGLEWQAEKGKRLNLIVKKKTILSYHSAKPLKHNL